MKSLTKILLGATAMAFVCAGASTLCFNSVENAYADTNSNVLVEFSETDTKLFGTHADTEFKTDVQTSADSETVPTAVKVRYNAENTDAGGWALADIVFKESFTADSAFTMSIRIYTHILSTPGTEAPTVAIMSRATGAAVLWKLISKDQEWNTFTITREDYKKMANEEGVIEGFTIKFYKGNGTAFSDSYVLLDNIVIDDAYAVTLDNDKANTGVDPTDLRFEGGSTLIEPTSQIFGKGVTWYADAERTIPYDFTNKTVDSNITLYGAYSETLEPTKGVVTEFSRADARYFIPLDAAGNQIFPDGSGNYISKDYMEYLSNVDVDGNGKIDEWEKNTIKVSNWGYRESIGFEFANPVDIDDVMGITFRIYADFKGAETKKDTNGLWCCEGAIKENGDLSSYTNGILFDKVQQGTWYDVTFPAQDKYSQVAGADGKFDSFLWSFWITTELGELPPSDTYVVFGGIYYNYKCNVTFDCDTANTNVSNVTSVYSSGKPINEAPEATQREGYKVTWYKDPERTQRYSLKTNMLDGDITLYAKYELSDYTVTFDYDKAESGINPQTVTVSVGGKVTPPTIEREGYTIKWCTDPELTSLYDFDAGVTKNITLYAKYVKNSNSGGESGKGGCGSVLASDIAICTASIAGAALAIVAGTKRRKKDN